MALAALLLAVPARAQIPIETVSLEMKPLDAKVLFRKDPFDKSSFPVKVVSIDGEALNLDGRIEVKGSFTRRTGKPSVLIKLDGKWHGQSRLSYNGMGTDLSVMREWLAWDLMHALKMVTPETRYARLVINGAEQGLFLRIEWVDTKVFERFGLGGDGEMFHPWDSTFCGDLTPGSLDPERECWLKLAPRGSKDFSALADLVHAIDATPVDDFDRLLDQRFDADSVINWFAVNTLVASTDTYNKNYFLYLSRKTGKFLVVPWDFDITWGRSYDPYRDFPFTILNDQFQYYVPTEAGQSNPLHYQALKNAKLRARLAARIAELIDGAPDAAHPWRGWFSHDALQRRIDELRDALAPEVARDPILAPQREKHEDEVASVRFFAHARADYLRQALMTPSSWLRDSAVAATGAGQSGDAVDGWGFLLARVQTHVPARARAEVAVVRGWPELVPDGVDRAACVQRTWFVSAPGAVADLTLTYLDEDSHSHELGAAVTDERALRLYARDAGGWRALPTVAAPLADTLTTSSLSLPATGRVQLVGCVPPAAVAAAH